MSPLGAGASDVPGATGVGRQHWEGCREQEGWPGRWGVGSACPRELGAQQGHMLGGHRQQVHR